MKIFIKDMLCSHCRKNVENEMDKIGISYSPIKSNEVEIKGTVSKDQLLMLQKALIPYGMSMVLDARSILIEKIRSLLNHLVNSNLYVKTDLHEYLKHKVKAKYNTLNRIFKEETGDTIDNYFASVKIKKMNMFLQSGGLSLPYSTSMMIQGKLVQFFNQFREAS